MKNYKTRNFFESLKHAFEGINKMLKERNIIIYLLIDIAFVTLNIIHKSTKIEWMFLILLSLSVYVTETINTAIENIVDKLEPNENIYAKNAKDFGAAAVLLCGIAFFISEGIILLW